jgi:hypothetical protein
MTNKKIENVIQGYEIIERVVKPTKTSGYIYLPRSWVGAKVKIVRVEKGDVKNGI